MNPFKRINEFVEMNVLASISNDHSHLSSQDAKMVVGIVQGVVYLFLLFVISVASLGIFSLFW